MRPFLWLSLIPLTAFWLWAVDIYGLNSSPIPVAAFILLGIALSAAGFWRTEAVLDKRYTIALVPLALSYFVIPYPYNAGMVVSALALLASLISLEFKLKPIWSVRLGLVGLGALFAGIVLIVQSLALSIYYIFAPSYHEVSWLAAPLAYLMGLTGLETVSNQGIILVLAQKDVFPFTITLEKLGFYPWILILAGSVVLISLTSRGTSDSLKGILAFIAASFAYLLLRYLVLVHIFFVSDMPEFAMNRMQIFIDPWWLLASFAPLVLAFLWLYPTNTDDDSISSKFDFRLDIDRQLAITFLAVVVSTFCLISAMVFQDPGIEKSGRVLVDEIHSLWESSTLKMDKSWYGEGSTYNAYSMVEWLKDTYHVDRIVSPSYKDTATPGAAKVVSDLVSDSLTYDILKNYDILIIKTPSQYAPEEIEAIVRFVENGGGLFLIGDHTNFAGTGTNLNQISRRFGIEFGFDSVNTINGTLYYYKRGQLPHPVIKYMPRLDFMTGCSLKVPLSGEPAILGFGMSSEPGEYSSVGFFRETRANDPTHVTDTTWGLINQAVALNYGKGRVVAFADSTVISNFRIFFGGSPNLVIGAMEYLNHENSYPGGKQILFLIGSITAVLGAYLLGRRSCGDRKMAVLVLVLSLGALSASGALLAFSTKAEDTVPSQYYVRNHTISFDGEHSDTITGQGHSPGQYETFYIWTQRVNLTPVLADSLDEAMAKGRITVVIDPIKPLSKEELASMLSYVKEGHSLLLMMSSDGPWSDIPRSFGMETYRINGPINVPINANNTNIPGNKTIVTTKDGLPIKPWGLSIKGGRAFLATEGRVVLAEASYGKGKFLLFTDSGAFKDGLYGNPGFMGYSKVEPGMVDKKDYDLMALYNLEYRLFEDYLLPGKDIPAAYG